MLHEPPRDISPERVSQHLSWLASQDKGPVLTLLALLALRAVLHSSGPCLTRHGTCINHACPPRLPFTLDVEHGWETLLHGDLATLVQHMLGSIEIHLFSLHTTWCCIVCHHTTGVILYTYVAGCALPSIQ